MSGAANFPTALDDDSSLGDVTDGVSALTADHHNNIKEAVKKIEAKLGINVTSAPTSIDYRLGNPTNSHKHDGASGQGARVNPTAILVPSGGAPSGMSLHEHLMDLTLHTPTALTATGMASLVAPNMIGVPTVVPRYALQLHMTATAIIGSKVAAPVVLGRTLQLESIQGGLRRGPSGATLAFDVNNGPTSIYEASQGFRPIFPPGATAYRSAATPNLVTIASGSILSLDVDAVGSNEPGQDLNLTFFFRE